MNRRLYLTLNSLTDKTTFDRIIQRERAARKEAERIMEDKSRELFDVNEKLVALNTNLEEEISKRTEKIKESESQLNILFNKHPFPIMVYNLADLRILAVNKTAVQKYGYSNSEFLRMTICDLHHKSDSKNVIKYVKSIGEKPKKNKTWTHIGAKGNTFEVITKGNSIDFQNLKARIVVIEDITEKKKLEEEKENQKRKYQDLIESSSDIIYRIKSNGAFTYVNPACIKLTGYSQKELLSMTFSDLVTPKYKKQVSSFYNFQLESKLNATYTEFPIHNKNGKEIWLGQNVETSGYNIDKGISFNATARDITDRKKLEKALQRSEEKYRSIIENMELGLVEVDPEGVIINAYPRFCSLTGYSVDELKGRKGADFLLDDKGREKYKPQLKDRKEGKGNVYEIQIIRKDGVKIWVLVSGAPFYDEYNRIKGSFGIHLDITEQKMLEVELKVARDKAEDSLKSKELFLANISHEIRTPLNAIIGITELMNKIAKDPQLLAQLKHVNHASSSLLSLINELLLLAKIEAQKEKIEPVTANLYSCLNQSFELLRNQTIGKGFDYSMELKIDKEAYYLFDPIKLGQVVQNLLSNAIKFTTNGYVDFKTEIFSSSFDSDVIQFVISDSGIGIPKTDIDSIFENFEQATNNSNGVFGGTGLGLPIVKKILDLMGGEISVFSNEGKTSFEFFLKLKKIKKNELETQAKKIVLNQKNFSGVKILVAEDNKVNQFLIESQMINLKADFTIVDNGLEALEYIKSNEVDLVLMDMRMPIMNGIKATEIIREDSKFSDLKIIGLTANADKANKDECYNVGMNDFLSKPYSFDQLHAILIKNLNPKLLSKNNDLSGSIENEVDHEDAFQKKLNSIFIKDSHIRILELKQSIINKDIETVKNICHAIRPSLSHLKQTGLIDLARTLEFEECDFFATTEMFVVHLETLIIRMQKLQ